MGDLTPYLWSVLANVALAPVLIALAGLIPEPWRQRSMSALITSASLTYIGGGLGWWEFPFALMLVFSGLVGWRWYPAIGLGWLIHTASDILHHLTGNPMVEAIPLSSFGCAVLDPLLAIWFLLGAPSTRRMIGLARRQALYPAG